MSRPIRCPYCDFEDAPLSRYQLDSDTGIVSITVRLDDLAVHYATHAWDDARPVCPDPAVHDDKAQRGATDGES